MEGIVNMQLSPKNTGLFDAFYNSVKVTIEYILYLLVTKLAVSVYFALLLQPIQLVSSVVEISPSGKIPSGVTEIPFEIPLSPRQNRVLYETYHGVFINIQYSLKCELRRSFLSKDIIKVVEFIVEHKKVAQY